MNKILRLSLVVLFAMVFGISQAQIFTETFSKCEGKGGNDGTFSGISGNKELADDYTDNAGWTSVKATAANGCVSVGQSKAAGSVTTPALTTLNGNATLTFRAAAWAKDGTSLTLAIEGSGKLDTETVTLQKGAFSDYTVQITGGSSDTKITFKSTNASSNRFFLDDVIITAASGDVKKSAGLAFSETSIQIKQGSEFTAPTFTKETTAAVTFTSDNEEVAKVGSDGTISLAGGLGTATITASAEANDEYNADEATCKISVYTYNVYTKVTTVTSGKKYLIVAQRNDSTVYAYPADATKTYGYLYCGTIKESTDSISVKSLYDDAFTITGDETNGYTIIDCYSRQLYQTGTYNSFNLSSTEGTNYLWTIEPQSDGTFKISMNDYFIQWGSGTYKTFGVYTKMQNNAVLPMLYQLSESTTGIETFSVKKPIVDAPIYNLSGQRLQKMQKGINIVGGKKIILK